MQPGTGLAVSMLGCVMQFSLSCFGDGEAKAAPSRGRRVGAQYL